MVLQWFVIKVTDSILCQLFQPRRLLAANFTHLPSWVYKQYDAVSFRLMLAGILV